MGIPALHQPSPRVLQLRENAQRSRAKEDRNIMNILRQIPVWAFLLIATTLEVSGDAVVRIAIYNHAGVTRLAFMLAGAALLLGYGVALNLAPVEFGRVVGLYLATLFVVWQIINFIAFRTLPTLPILVGGALVIAGGLIVTFWKPGFSN
jgi:small multidrug resistance family-3 protein